MELKLKAKEDRPNNEGIGIAESPKSKFFSTRGGCGNDIKNKLIAFFCPRFYEVIEIPVRHAISKKCFIRHEKYKKDNCSLNKNLVEFYYIPVHDSVCGINTIEEIFDPNYFYYFPH